MNVHAPDQFSDWFREISETEMALVAGMLMAPPAISSVMLTGLTEEHFGDMSAAALYRRTLDIVARGGVIDFRTVIQGGASLLMGESGTINDLMARMAAIAAPPGSLAEYAKIIRSAWVLRRIFDAADGARSQIATADVTNMAKGLIDAVDELRDAANDQRRSNRGSLSTIAEQVGREAEAMLRGEVQRPPSTGIEDLDRHLPLRGLAPGALYVLAGRTGQGKTMMGAALASKMCRRGDGALYFSLEVPSKEIAARIICERLGGKGPTYGNVLSGHATENELESYLWAAHESKKEPLHLDDTPGLSMADILVEGRKYADRLDKQGKRLRLAIVDHAMLVKPSGRYQGNKVNELGEIANAAKVMAKNLDCTVMLCCQLARAVEQRDDKRPNLSDLRASGEIEEAADAVLMLYREHYYATRTEAYRRGNEAAQEQADAIKNDLEVGVEKSRQGQTGRVNLWCDPGRSIVAARFGGGR